MSNGFTRSCLVTVAVLAGAPASHAAPDLIAPLLWKARPVVVLADHPDDPRFQRQMAVFDAKHVTLANYDIRVVSVPHPDSVLRAKLGVPATGFSVVLVGKDGGVKESWRQPVDPARIFALIDTMPMRRDEVRDRR